MQKQKAKQVEEKHKRLIINGLYTGVLIILFLGLFFCAYITINQISLRVLSTRVPGFVFGLLVVYLGIRFYFQVTDFKTELMKNHYIFSWDNFRRKKMVQVKKKL
jgi:hypothetical protein